MTERSRQLIAGGVALAVLALAAAMGPWGSDVSDGPNIVLILSDDQSMDSMSYSPTPMPFLHSQVTDPDGHWITFTDAHISDPLCCPSRATILSGQYAFNTGVTKNGSGKFFQEDSTLATWLDDVGYRTGMFGKYINQYPFKRSPYVPPGWDTWAAKYHGPASTVYYDYQLVEGQGEVVSYGHDPEDWMSTVLADKAISFIRDRSPLEPFFLEYAPTAPHAPWVPAPGDYGAYAGAAVPVRPNVNEVNRYDKPQWVQDLPSLSERRMGILLDEQRREYETLLGFDAEVERIYDALAEEGILDDTVVIYLTDNGYSYGSHDWTAKRCPYEECNATPMYVRMPGAQAREIATPVSNVDLAPTIAALAGAEPGIPVDGEDLGPLLAGKTGELPRPGVLLEWPGDSSVPAYWGLQTPDAVWVEYSTGERELYDLTGVIGEPDPYELHNVAYDERYASMAEALSAQLLDMVPAGATVPPPPFVPPSPSPSVTPSVLPSLSPAPTPVTSVTPTAIPSVSPS